MNVSIWFEIGSSYEMSGHKIKLYIFFSECRFVLANSVEPDEMPQYLRLRGLPK